MDTSKAAAALGKLGGKAGTGEAKRRGASAYYSELRTRRGNMTCADCMREISKAEPAVIVYRQPGGRAARSQDRGILCPDCFDMRRETMLNAGHPLTKVSAYVWEPIG